MPDVEALLIGWLAARFPAARVLTDTPANLADILPVIQVIRFGGPTDRRLDRPSLDVDCYAASRQAASALASEVRDAILAELPGTTTGGGFITRAICTSGPSERPYDNTSLRRFGLVVALVVQPA